MLGHICRAPLKNKESKQLRYYVTKSVGTYLPQKARTTTKANYICTLYMQQRSTK